MLFMTRITKVSIFSEALFICIYVTIVLTFIG